jgi:hypothetical protein
MCVLYGCVNRFPTLETLKANQRANNDGGGVAWIDKGRVRWIKGIADANDLYRYACQLPFPFLIHQRMTSAGSAVPELTHPFPIDKGASLSLRGSAGAVLAHNGTMFGWHEALTALERKKDKYGPLPEGPWSDTRLLAYLMAWDFRKAVNTLGRGEKLAILDAKQGLVICEGKQWWKKPSDEATDGKALGFWQSSDYGWYGRMRDCDAANEGFYEGVFRARHFTGAKGYWLKIQNNAEVKWKWISLDGEDRDPETKNVTTALALPPTTPPNLP